MQGVFVLVFPHLKWKGYIYVVKCKNVFRFLEAILLTGIKKQKTNKDFIQGSLIMIVKGVPINDTGLSLMWTKFKRLMPLFFLSDFAAMWEI